MSSVFYILITLAIIGLAIYIRWYNSSTQKGKRGESFINNVLLHLPDEYFVLNNIMLDTGKGTTQIDHVVVSKYGIFAIETKNYRGDIYGDDNRKQWTQLIVTDVTYRRKWYKTYTYVTKNHFYNPIKQSLAHCYAIKNLLKEWPHLKVVPIVVFAGDAVLKNVITNHHVVYDFELLDTINKYRTIYLPDKEVEKVADAILNKDASGYIDNNAHVYNIHLKKFERNSKIASGICPKCGGTLVERQGKYGSFRGCSNYPKCRFTT